MNIKKALLNKESHLSIAREITKFLEAEFSIWKFKFGVDPILGLVPGLGDLLPFILSFYIIYVAILYRIPAVKIIRMIFNILADFIIGSVPIIGDMFDFFIKPNTKNLYMLEKEIDKLENIKI